MLVNPRYINKLIPNHPEITNRACPGNYIKIRSEEAGMKIKIHKGGVFY